MWLQLSVFFVTVSYVPFLFAMYFVCRPGFQPNESARRRYVLPAESLGSIPDVGRLSPMCSASSLSTRSSASSPAAVRVPRIEPMRSRPRFCCSGFRRPRLDRPSAAPPPADARWNVFWPIPNGIYQCLRFYFQAQGISRPAMWNNLAFVFVNAGLNWLFV